MQTKELLMEVALNAAVMMSLLVPCFILHAFRNFTDTGDWDLMPIKTVLGDIDLRRYVVIANGQGSTASNIDSFSRGNCQDYLLGSCVYPPKILLRYIDRTAAGH